MENLTLEQAVENHRKLWHEIFNITKYESYDRLSIRPDLEIKAVAFQRVFPDQGDVHGLCWLCEYARENIKSFHDACEYCPLVKKENVEKNGCLNGLYYEYLINVPLNRDIAASIAEQIANLPVVNTGGNDAEQL